MASDKHRYSMRQRPKHESSAAPAASQRKTRRVKAMTTLSDAPDPWLDQLISGPDLDSASKLSLFQTCKRLSKVVMQSSRRSSLSLDLLARPLRTAFQNLKRANRLAPSIKLTLHDSCDGNKSADAETQMGHIVVSFLQAAAELSITNDVVELRVKDTLLDSILPPAIGQACKNLTRLTLHNCKISTSRTASLTRDFRNLQFLELERCDCYEAASSAEDELSQADTDLQGQTALRSLTVLHECSDFEGEVSIVNSLAAPLTHLCFDTMSDDDTESVGDVLAELDWMRLGATLQHLQLPGLEVGDDAMNIFLEMPCLTHVLVYVFNLEESFAEEPCNWEELICQSQMDVQTLACLPLHPGMVLKLGRSENHRECSLRMDIESLHLIPEAIANVQRAKALDWAGGRASLYEREMPADLLAEWLAQALPLIRGVKELTFDSGHLNGAAMQALCNLVQDRVDEPCIRLSSNTTWEIGDLTALVEKMPHNSTIHVCLEGP